MTHGDPSKGLVRAEFGNTRNLSSWRVSSVRFSNNSMYIHTICILQSIIYNVPRRRPPFLENPLRNKNGCTMPYPTITPSLRIAHHLSRTIFNPPTKYSKHGVHVVSYLSRSQAMQLPDKVRGQVWRSRGSQGGVLFQSIITCTSPPYTLYASFETLGSTYQLAYLNRKRTKTFHAMQTPTKNLKHHTNQHEDKRKNDETSIHKNTAERYLQKERGVG